MKHIFSTLLIALLPSLVGAQTLKPQTVDTQGSTAVTYVCEVILVASDVPADGGIWKFQTEVKEGSHGGDPRVFSSGTHEVHVIADGTWLGLSWFRNERKVAESLFVMGPMDRAFHRVGLLYDPADEDAQVSIGCTKGKL